MISPQQSNTWFILLPCRSIKFHLNRNDFFLHLYGPTNYTWPSLLVSRWRTKVFLYNLGTFSNRGYIFWMNHSFKHSLCEEFFNLWSKTFVCHQRFKSTIAVGMRCIIMLRPALRNFQAISLLHHISIYFLLFSKFIVN